VRMEVEALLPHLLKFECVREYCDVWQLAPPTVVPPPPNSICNVDARTNCSCGRLRKKKNRDLE
jgi:hypothetical protein